MDCPPTPLLKKFFVKPLKVEVNFTILCENTGQLIAALFKRPSFFYFVINNFCSD